MRYNANNPVKNVSNPSLEDLEIRNERKLNETGHKDDPKDEEGGDI